MSVRVSIVEGPVPERKPDGVNPGVGVGALLVFDGIVREQEGEGVVGALDYEVYEPMASRMLERIGTETVRKHQLIALEVEHSKGRVPVGRASLRVTIRSAHRGEALAAMTDFIDLLKRDVPIWKKPVWSK